MDIGKKIKQLRFRSGLTQEKLAEKLGVGAQAVSKWETSVTMPDVTLLPLIAEAFGVSIDDLFDLTAEQKLNRIENRLDTEKELPNDVFREYEEYLKAELSAGRNVKRATALISYLYWHRFDSDSEKASRYAEESIRLSPDEKNCQWILVQTKRHAVWDWNLANHSEAIEFYRGLVNAHPKKTLPYCYLIDNLIADHRADEAEKYLSQYSLLEKANPIMTEAYRAHIALARYDEPTADAIVKSLCEKYPDDSDCLFETAQYYAKKCKYISALEYYEKSFEKDSKRPRFIDPLHAISEIQEILGAYRAAADTYDRIIDVLKTEWNMTEDVELKNAEAEKDRLMKKAEKRNY